MNLLDRLPEILQALPTHPVALVALGLLVLGFLAYLVIDKKDHPGLRYSALLLSLLGLGLLAWKILAIDKGIKLEAHLNEVQPCVGHALVALDDHYGSDGSYQLAVSIEGREAYRGSLRGVIPHGEPYAGPFTNWTQLPLAVQLTNRIIERPSLETEFQLGGSSNANDFLGVAELALDCGEKDFKQEIRDLHAYGPGGRPTGILYIGGTKRWALSGHNA